MKDPPGFKGHYFIIEGMEPKKLTGLFNAGLSPKEVKEQQDRDPDMKECPPGAYDPIVRMEDLEKDGVEAEVIYTSLAFDLFRLTDAPFQEAVFAAYNTWLAEFLPNEPQAFGRPGADSANERGRRDQGAESVRRVGLEGRG